MRLFFEVEVLDANIDLDNYKCEDPDCTDPACEPTTVQDAVEMDLEMYRDGEISLEEMLLNLGGEVLIKLNKIVNNESILDNK
ncbi:hypothetical protein TIN4_42 [Tsukamurella phage TIN4]|uniref:Uncharacterized protein n=2 Tax=Tinduovirus TIN3 TaxID=1982571 RepID=A0A0K0N624_9CAUD|nr:hypothetical protein AVT54_gp083 [Tsukamurella phage TIN3]YP_009604172.1 hypothetical protein FDH87_gp083 [Tsukamurella phage TIN4]AKJ71839.1 hypothetical protein TIN3_42 [Tsukamurella phage TIN3]AKJ71948.1 hypothetical protein TIN4_42 [Tsukamurella phage TIN4]